MFRILIVVDEERLCSAIAAYLETLETHPIVTYTVQEAINILDSGGVDLVVQDLKMRHGNGLEVLKHIRATPDLADLPVLALAPWEMEPASYDYLEPGDYLTKPFDMRLLDGVIRQFLKHPQGRRLGLPASAPQGEV